MLRDSPFPIQRKSLNWTEQWYRPTRPAPPTGKSDIALWRSLLFANQVRIVFFVFSDRFHQFLIGHEIQAGEFDGPRSCICPGVFDGDFQIDVPKIAARVALGDARRF